MDMLTAKKSIEFCMIYHVGNKVFEKVPIYGQHEVSEQPEAPFDLSALGSALSQFLSES